MESRKQATPVFTTICVLIGVVVTVQLWLLSASLEAMLAGDNGAAVSGTAASAVLFCISGGLLVYATSLDRRFGQ
jgi:hypothetical protein